MNWTEETTEQYLQGRGVKYHKYQTIFNDYILGYNYCPEVTMLRYGNVDDSCTKRAVQDGVVVEVHSNTIVAELDSGTLIIRDTPNPEHNSVYLLISRDGCTGDAQVGGTLESFLTYLNAWSSMANTPDPFAENPV